MLITVELRNFVMKKVGSFNAVKLINQLYDRWASLSSWLLVIFNKLCSL